MIKLANGEETLSVGELKAALKGIPNDLPVDIFVPYPQAEPDGYYVITAKRHAASGVSGAAFSLHTGKPFYF